MSIDATRWAWQQKVGRSTEKLVLLSLADRANEKHECYPSIERLALDTGCNRKTVMDAIQRLADQGLIAAEKSWGRGTRYQLVGVVDRHGNQYQKRDQSQDRDKSQKRDGTSTKNGTGPVPKTGHEPINNQSITDKGLPPSGNLDLTKLPETLSDSVWTDYWQWRKQQKLPLSQSVIDRLSIQLRQCEEAGYSPDDAMGTAMERGWRTVKLQWLENENAKGKQSGGNSGSRAKRVADKLESIARNGLASDTVGGAPVPDHAEPLRQPLDGEYRRH